VNELIKITNRPITATTYEDASTALSRSIKFSANSTLRNFYDKKSTVIF